MRSAQWQLHPPCENTNPVLPRHGQRCRGIYFWLSVFVTMFVAYGKTVIKLSE